MQLFDKLVKELTRASKLISEFSCFSLRILIEIGPEKLKDTIIKHTLTHICLVLNSVITDFFMRTPWNLMKTMVTGSGNHIH